MKTKIAALCASFFISLVSSTSFASDYDFYPSCSKASKLGSLSLSGSEWGWVNTSSQGGFSCRGNSSVSDDAFPICHSAATQKSGNEIFEGGDWGWVKGNGFSCEQVAGDSPVQNTPPSPPTSNNSRNDIAVTDGKFKVVHLFVSHGDSTFVFLPNGKTMLIDTGQYYWAKQYLIPFIRNQGIHTIDYLVITHSDGDHIGGLGLLDDLVNQGKLQIFHKITNDQAQPADVLGWFRSHDFGLNISVLSWYDNSIVHKDWCYQNTSWCRNERSLSLRFEYNGFVYTSGADIYAEQQDKILREQAHLVPAHVYRTNHHMHGSVSTSYLEATNPTIFITSADKSVKERSAYTVELQSVVDKLWQNSSHFEGSYLTEDHGHVVISANDGSNWTWELYGDSGSRHYNSVFNIPNLK